MNEIPNENYGLSDNVKENNEVDMATVTLQALHEEVTTPEFQDIFESLHENIHIKRLAGSKKITAGDVEKMRYERAFFRVPVGSAFALVMVDKVESRDSNGVEKVVYSVVEAGSNVNCTNESILNNLKQYALAFVQKEKFIAENNKLMGIIHEIPLG